MTVLSDLRSQEVFKYFEELSAVPRGSGHTDKVVDYLLSFAAEHNLDSYRDDANNVIIRKAASKGYENADILVLQGHHDMVCEKADGVEHDFENDGIEVYVDGDWLRAKGTTLGGDNGIAVAMMLAILADEELPHPALEMLFTADEEIGMLGAFAFDCSQLKGHKLINLDSEYEGVLMCSCAGGANVRSRISVNLEQTSGTVVTVSVKGLKGGHSGVEIDKGRANSNVLLARLLKGAVEAMDVRLVAIEGGTRETAIANTAEMKVIVSDEKAFLRVAEEMKDIFIKEYATAEPDMEIAFDCDVGDAMALTLEDTKKVANVMVALPDAVQAMSIDMPGLVQTSTNWGLLKLEGSELAFCNTVRSSMTTQKRWIIAKIKAIVGLAGGECEIQGDYPGWAFNPNSEVTDVILKSYKKLFGKDAKVDAVHAGIECGLFADAIPNLDCVSIGPEMAEVHTPNEHLSIASTARTYELLKEVLKESK